MLNNYKFVILLNDGEMFTCGRVNISPDGVIETDNPEYPIISIKELSSLSIQGEL